MLLSSKTTKISHKYVKVSCSRLINSKSFQLSQPEELMKELKISV